MPNWKDFVCNIHNMMLMLGILCCVSLGVRTIKPAIPAELSINQQKQTMVDTQCFSYEDTELFLHNLGEELWGYRFEDNGMLSLVFESENGETWTHTLIFPRHGMNGEDVACITAFGVKENTT
jgi:hypothetical protein